ncbi:DUF2291 family protein [Marinomonas sp.]|uniref:DUF2291 family protein n=1 Tax=Marinomonas sp. TaxID=1904862 RepID=UPI003F9C14ED
MSFKNLFHSLGLLLSLCLLTACTVTDLDENGNPIIPKGPNAVVGYEHLSLSEVADMLWAPKVLPEAKTDFVSWDHIKSQLDAQQITEKNSVFVRLNGVIDAVELGKHRGVIRLNLGDRSVDLQVGRIIKGNAIRDASKFVLFDDFKNQIRFAQISRELNKRAMTTTGTPEESWVGQKATVIAAITISDNRIRDAVPIQVNLGDQ